MKFAICQELFEGWEWERQCALIAEIGYTGIEAAPFTLASTIYELSADRRVELREQAEAHGLEIIGLHWLPPRQRCGKRHATTWSRWERPVPTSAVT